MLAHSHCCTILGPQGESFRGGDQAWYRDDWQRRAGCGPTTAALCLSYLGRTSPILQALAPQLPQTVETFLSYMEEVWQFVTPTQRGLDSLERFGVGCQAFAQSRGCPLSWSSLAVPGLTEDHRPTQAQCAAFLKHSLERDTPVGFLNFSNGAVEELDSWHWVPLIWLEEMGDTLTCGILDAGREFSIDLSLWLRTTRLGGGFVTLFSP